MLENHLVTPRSSVSPRPRKRLVVATTSPDAVLKRGTALPRSRKAGFKKSDVWRAISAAQKGGVIVSEMEIAHDGAIRLKFATDQLDSAGPAGNGPFDQWADRL